LVGEVETSEEAAGGGRVNGDGRWKMGDGGCVAGGGWRVASKRVHINPKVF